MTNQVLQQKVQMLKPEYQERLIKEQTQALNDLEYKWKIPEQMPRFRQFSFMHENESSLNISFAYWKYCCFGKNIEYNFNDITIFLIASQRRTFKEWISLYGTENSPINDFTEYKLFVEELENLANPIIDEICEELIDKLLKIQHLNITNTNEYKKNKGNVKEFPHKS